MVGIQLVVSNAFKGFYQKIIQKRCIHVDQSNFSSQPTSLNPSTWFKVSYSTMHCDCADYDSVSSFLPASFPEKFPVISKNPINPWNDFKNVTNFYLLLKVLKKVPDN